VTSAVVFCETQTISQPNDESLIWAKEKNMRSTATHGRRPSRRTRWPNTALNTKQITLITLLQQAGSFVAGCIAIFRPWRVELLFFSPSFATVTTFIKKICVFLFI